MLRRLMWQNSLALLWSLLLAFLLPAAVLAQVQQSTLRVAAQGKTATRVAVPLQQVTPFLALGVTWQAEPQATKVFIRTSVDGAQWGEWIALQADHDATAHNEDEGPKANAAHSLVLLDAATKWVEIKAATGVLPPVQFHFISPGATSEAAQAQIQQRQAQLQLMTNERTQMNPKYPKPPVVTRTEWGCPDGQITKHGSLAYTTVTHLIVHHTATGNTPANNDWPAVMRSIWNFHIFTNGWSDVGYNYLIDPNGVIYEGRSGGDNVQGAHFSGVNGGTMGVSMLGTFTSVTPTAQALQSLRRLLAWKADQRGIDPAGRARHAASGLELNVISGHRDGPGATECPGNALYPLLPTLRTGVKQLLGNAVSALASVSAASFSNAALAGDSIVAAFGTELATEVQVAQAVPLPTSLAGTAVTVRDSLGKEQLAPLFFVSPGQVNFLLPSGLANGTATVTLSNANGTLASGTVTLATIAPALFAAAASGRGALAGYVVRVKADGTQSFESIITRTATGAPVLTAIDVSNESEAVFLVAFGTGLRYRTALSAVSAAIGGAPVPVLFAGAVEGSIGLDQLNLRLPATLTGRGEMDVNVLVDGSTTNALRILIK